MALSTQERLKADGLLLVITALWGGTFVVVKDSLDRADPFTFLAIRFAIGAVALALVARRSLLDGPSFRYGLVLGSFLFLGFSLQTVGLQSTTPSRSAFITGLSVVLVPFVGVVMFKRWPRVPSLVGVACAVAGMWQLTMANVQEDGVSTLRGDLLTLGCAVAYALHIAVNERFAPKAKASAMVTVQLALVSVLSLLCVPVFGMKLQFDGMLLWGVAFTGLFASALAILVQTWAQAHTTAVHAAVIFSLEPVFAAIYSVLAGREVLGKRELIGGALIVAGVAVAEIGTAVWDKFARPVGTSVGGG